MYKILYKDGDAKRGQLETVHGTIQTPVFMNVGTDGVMKGAVSTQDLQGIKTQVVLCNTYHLHVRPGDGIVRDMVVYVSLWSGISLYLLILVVSRCFHLQACGKLKKKAFILVPILMAGRFSWVQKKVCRYSQILRQQ